MEFSKEEAKPANVHPDNYSDFEFLRYNPEHGKDGDRLISRAYEADIEMEDLGIDPYAYKNIQKGVKDKTREAQGKITILGDVEYSSFDIQEEIERNDFPKTINYILENIFADGKKRALFVLLTFLYAVNWKKDNIEILIDEWNNKQSEGLKQNYISAQINWFESQDKKISTPSFGNDNYYKSIGIPYEVIKEDANKFNERAKSPLHLIAIKVELDKKNELIKKNKKKSKNVKEDLQEEKPQSE